MKVILSIGHTDILLPDDKGLSTIIRALSRGLVCRNHLYSNEVVVCGEVAIEFATVPTKARIIKEADAPDPTAPLALYDKPKGDA